MKNRDLIAPGTWRKSSRSNAAQDACVEVGGGERVIGVRDTKDRDGGTLVFGDDTWREFAAQVKAGRFDL
ncbi:DUF397 domain-containing protein [Actinomadura verrucosospora]|uniref:DUF397 domain-containing protein n=1 Tax=Actinomadura verrucosospora TaxID=46165 RepID=A0A7D3ZPX9_ACTVE|nr:DUF397 domain-containing protein [Actinomadura verrucosospora]QKG24383.1 hypothetical protein ACTIVE_6030 [Actinomadura verrucosospora]